MIGTRFVVGSLAVALGVAGVSQQQARERREVRKQRMMGQQQLQPSQVFRHKGLEGVMMTPDGTRLVSWSSDGTIRVWDLGAPAPHPPPPHPWPPPPPIHGWGGPPPPAWGFDPMMPPPFPPGMGGPGAAAPMEPPPPPEWVVNQPPTPAR